MANYDDIFNASAQKGTEDKSFVSFNKEEWAAQKKQERESAFAMIDETDSAWQMTVAFSILSGCAGAI